MGASVISEKDGSLFGPNSPLIFSVVGVCVCLLPPLFSFFLAAEEQSIKIAVKKVFCQRQKRKGGSKKLFFSGWMDFEKFHFAYLLSFLHLQRNCDSLVWKNSKLYFLSCALSFSPSERAFTQPFLLFHGTEIHKTAIAREEEGWNPGLRWHRTPHRGQCKERTKYLLQQSTLSENKPSIVALPFSIALAAPSMFGISI